MKGSSYGERDYAFGRLMLTLRTTIGPTQAGLAERIGVSRRAVAEWEAGSSYPKAERLKQFIELGVRASAFTAGHEEEAIRALWKAAHQKVLLDELWLQVLLRQQAPSLVDVAVEQPLVRTESVLLRLRRSRGWIGARRWMCPASMDARRNWPCSLAGWESSAVGW